MNFVRVGTNITEVESAPAFVRTAKGEGLLTFVNLMKTQVLGQKAIIDAVAACGDMGADAVYLVDSFGSLLPAETYRMVRAVIGSTHLPIGFHGHDNFGLANANALAAADAGAAYIDTTLDGIGRSAGNASTEVMATLLRKLGRSRAYDNFRLALASQDHIQTVERLTDRRFLQLVAAYTNIHSSYLPLFERCAGAEGVAIVELMTRVGMVDPVDPSLELILTEARAMRASEPSLDADHAHGYRVSARDKLIDRIG